MNKLRTFIIIIFSGTLLFMVSQQLYIAYGLGEHFNIVSLELANKQKVAVLLEQWHREKEPLISYAQLNTSVDYLFIIGYVGVLIIISYGLMQNQPENHLNNGLRFCMFLAVLAGLLDVAENSIMLLNMYHYKPDKLFMTAMFVSYPKWIILFIIILVWLISLMYSLLRKRISASYK